nr:nucleolar protein 9-like isoform X1 [Dermatophagoides pteronyssinus]
MKKKPSSKSSSGGSGKMDSSISKDNKDYDDSYFKRMHRRAQDKFHDPTDEELFIENLMGNIKGKEFKLCKYRHSSACLVWLLENMNDFNKSRKIIDKISPELFTIEWATDVNTHAVLESSYDILMKELAKQKNFETDTAKWIIKWMDGVAKFVIDNLKSFLNESTERENHLLITTMEALGGIRIGRGWNRKNMRFGNAAGAKIDLEAMISGDMIVKEIPQSSKHFLKRLAKTVILDAPEDECRDLIFSRCTSVGLYLLFILRVRYTELCQMIVKKLVEIVFATDEIRDHICQSANGAYIVEIMLLVASESRLSKIWTKYLKPNLKLFWRHEISQFIIQRLIDAIKEENLFCDVSQDLFPDLKELFKIGRSGIGVCLAKNCHDQPKMQTPLVTAMMKAFDSYEPKDKQLNVVPQMLFYEPSPNTDRRDSHSRRNFATQIWLYGSLMLQHMFTYKDPYKLSKSLLSMSIDNLMRTCQDRSGSHVIDSFLQSLDVEMKHKSDLVERLLGKYHLLACNKYGSRIVENIMKLSNEEVRTAITQELSKKESLLMKNRNGWFVAKNVGIHHFKKRPNDWRDVERGRMRRTREFGHFNQITKHRPDNMGGDHRPSFGGRPSFGNHDRRSSPDNRRRDGRRFERRGVGRRFH